MSQLQINRKEDLKQLRDEGYDVTIFDGHIVVRQIPFVNSNREIKYGILLSEYNISGEEIQKPKNHVMRFSGEYPCHADGSEIAGIKHSALNNKLPSGIKINFSFSNKPQGGFNNFYDKFISYIRIICAPAFSLDNSAIPNSFNPIEVSETESIFKYLDSNSSRAGIESINRKLENQKIAIVGLGGTGAYILDLISKSNVKEIHLYDGDVLLNHNAFRSPGAISLETLKQKPNKVDYYLELYSNLRTGIHAHSQFISNQNMQLLSDFDYVFLCLDDNEIRYSCAVFLRSNNIPFSDVGLGVYSYRNELLGSIRVTSSSPSKMDHLENHIPKTNEKDENEYSTNIQIAELNCLNATFAVLQWKKFCGFYQDLKRGHSISYSINDSNLINGDYET